MSRLDDILSDLMADVPNVTPDEILPGLWQGGTDLDESYGFPAQNAESPSGTVITLFGEAPPAPSTCEEHRFPFEDADLDPENVVPLEALADLAFDRWSQGASVLVRCEAGINRSALVVAMVLLRHGMTPEAAVSAIRTKRGPMALSNHSFEQWILSFSSAPGTS
jgi:hypothetical protein